MTTLPCSAPIPVLECRQQIQNLRRWRTRPAVRGVKLCAEAQQPAGGERDALPAELVRARQLKRLGLAFSGVMFAGGTTAAGLAGMLRPPPAEVLWAAAAAAAAMPAVLGTAKAALDISRGTHIGQYEGELLSEAQYWSRYPSGVSDYCIRIDSQWTIDGAHRAKHVSAFSACHINHASGAAANVARQTFRVEKVVRFFAARDVQAGEELLLDYGSVYWTGREHLIIE